MLGSYHQSPLPTALLLRLAGVPWVGAVSEDYPGSLLDLRHRLPEQGLHESERMLSLAVAAGYALPAGDDGGLRVRRPLPDVSAVTGDGPYVVVHPGASVPARQSPMPMATNTPMWTTWSPTMSSHLPRGDSLKTTRATSPSTQSTMAESCKSTAPRIAMSPSLQRPP